MRAANPLSEVPKLVFRQEQNMITWYEYFPKDEADFKSCVQSYLTSYRKQGEALRKRRAEVNTAMRRWAIDMPALDQDSAMEHWTEAYWQIFMKGGACLVYNKVTKAGVVLMLARGGPDSMYQRLVH